MKTQLNTLKSFFKDEIHGQDQEDKSDEVIKPEGFIFKNQQSEHGKDNQCDRLLDNL